MFRVGQKVVCVEEAGWYRPDTRETSSGPEYGDVVTVSAISRWRDIEIITLEEWGTERYSAVSFRPVQEPGMQMLRALLKTKPIKEVA